MCRLLPAKRTLFTRVADLIAALRPLRRREAAQFAVFAPPQGAFGEIPGIGPIPTTDTTFSVPRQPTVFASALVSQPLSQLFQIGLGIDSAVQRAASEAGVC